MSFVRRNSALVFQGGTVIDGTGRDRFTADLRVDGDRIGGIGHGLDTSDADIVDARGLIVAPGFIDVHTHDDQTVLAAPQMLPKITQGVTTVVVGNCGISLAPLVHADAPPPLTLLGGADKYIYPSMGAYAAAVARAQPATNVAALVGHSTLRVATMDDPYRAATSAEQGRMVALLREGLDAGAIGLSSGVFYATGAAADVDELALLASVAGEAGGVYTTHIRNEMNDIFAALEEAFVTGRRGNVPVVISHHKCAGPQNWGRTTQTLARIEEARQRQPIGLDAYPYIAGSTVLRADLVDGVIDVMVTYSESHPEMAARHLRDIAAEWDCSQQEACERLQPGGACYFQMHEEDVRRVLGYPATMIGSDGLPHDRHPHPRLWGTFPRVLGRYSRELQLFPLETAVHKMTGLSARRFNLHERGELRAGWFADVCVFDPATVLDTATFEQPQAVSRGIEHVMVNGEIALHRGSVAPHRAGRFLARK
jgi:N-acyl-D-amino-acid deacylase